MLTFYSNNKKVFEERSNGLFDVHCFNLTKEEVDEFINWKEIKEGYIVDKSSEQESKTQRKFLETLTAGEAVALTGLLHAINDSEGLISFNSLSEQLGVSRYHLASLCNKMKSAGLAIVRGSGVKGTYVKILDLAALKE